MSDYALVIVEEADDDRRRYKVILDEEVMVFRNDANEVFGIICGFHAGKIVSTRQPLCILTGPLVDQSSSTFQENYREGERLRKQHE